MHIAIYMDTFGISKQIHVINLLRIFSNQFILVNISWVGWGVGEVGVVYAICPGKDK